MTDFDIFTKQFLEFNSNSPSAFHVTKELKEVLIADGFKQLMENEKWNLSKGKYFVTRDLSSIIAFKIGKQEKLTDGFRLVGAHTDSPGLQIKPNCIQKKESYLKITAEIYGGPLLSTWFDRDLSIAGMVAIQDEEGYLKTLLIDLQRPLLNIPNLAIHLNREANTSASINKQKDLDLLFSQVVEDNIPDIKQIIKDQISKEHPETKLAEVLSFDLFCYDTQSPVIFGLNNEFITSGRLDNQLSCFAGLQALVASDDNHNSMLLCFNHEENGSTSTSGAAGSFAQSIFTRIYQSQEEKEIGIANSFLISFDNAHATHPNAPEKNDPNHQIKLNYGPVIKINANQRYASNAKSIAKYKLIATKAGLNCQSFVMRNNMPGGSTIGPTLSANLGVSCVDVGAASLAMHSIRETTGIKDPYFIYQSALSFFNGNSHRCPCE
ncbi:MAG: M18 family aminopeptidase [Desulfotalea sp.]